MAPLAALAAAALVLPGCGGSSDGSATANAATGSEEAATAQAEGGQPKGGAGGPAGLEIDDEARACLKQQGVELPEAGQGGGPPSGGEPPQGEGAMPQGSTAPNQKAFEECGIEMPQMNGAPRSGQGPPGGGGGPQS